MLMLSVICQRRVDIFSVLLCSTRDDSETSLIFGAPQGSTKLSTQFCVITEHQGDQQSPFYLDHKFASEVCMLQ